MSKYFISDIAGSTLYALIVNEAEQVYKPTVGAGGTTFEDYVTGNLALYQWTGADRIEEFIPGGFIFTWPTPLTSGVFNVVVKRRAAGSPAENDLPVGSVRIDGSVAGGSFVVVAPVGATVMTIPYSVSAGGLRKNLSVHQNTQVTFKWDVKDGDDNPVDLTGHTIKFACHDKNEIGVRFVVEDEDIVIAASNPSEPALLDQVQVTVEPEDVDDLTGVYEYKLWDLTIHFVWGDGDFIVYRAPLPIVTP